MDSEVKTEDIPSVRGFVKILSAQSSGRKSYNVLCEIRGKSVLDEEGPFEIGSTTSRFRRERLFVPPPIPTSLFL